MLQFCVQMYNATLTPTQLVLWLGYLHCAVFRTTLKLDPDHLSPHQPPVLFVLALCSQQLMLLANDGVHGGKEP